MYADDKQQPSDVFAQRLGEIRRERALSLDALATMMRAEGFSSMSKSAVLRVESGERGISLDEALGFAAVLSAVPVQMVSPPDDQMVWLTETRGADGAGMRAWLRYGDSVIASAGDLDADWVEQLRLKAIAIHARALLDAIRLKDGAGQREALQAIADIYVNPGVAPAEIQQREES